SHRTSLRLQLPSHLESHQSPKGVPHKKVGRSRRLNGQQFVNIGGSYLLNTVKNSSITSKSRCLDAIVWSIMAKMLHQTEKAREKSHAIMYAKERWSCLSPVGLLHRLQRY